MKKDKLLNIICVVIICLVGFSNITFFITDVKVRRETMHVSLGRQDIFSEINNNTEKDAKVYIINQEDTNSIMPLWYARYYCYPRIINVHPTAITWKVKTKSNEWDLQDWGLTKDTFEKHLIEYKFDYVFFYSSTDELEEEISGLFDTSVNLEKNKLYKIEYRSDSDIILKKIK